MNTIKSIINNRELSFEQKKCLIDDMINNNHTININFKGYINDYDAVLYVCKHRPQLYKSFFSNSNNFTYYLDGIYSMDKNEIKNFVGIVIDQFMRRGVSTKRIMMLLSYFEDVIDFEIVYGDIVNSNSCARYEYLQVHNYFRNNKVDINKYADKLIIALIKDVYSLRINRNFMIDIDIPLTHTQIELLHKFGLYPPLDNNLTRELRYNSSDYDEDKFINSMNKYPHDTIHGFIFIVYDVNLFNKINKNIPHNRIHISFAILLSYIFVHGCESIQIKIKNKLKSCKTLEDFDKFKKTCEGHLGVRGKNIIANCVVNEDDFALCKLF